mmetsp:Transcript_36225/g.90153  ORF Transcript_36225/g.90153 Transcript_36225/m.90153 type:complete len:112 (+) Transcript_36225:886-1221(+)
MWAHFSAITYAQVVHQPERLGGRQHGRLGNHEVPKHKEKICWAAWAAATKVTPPTPATVKVRSRKRVQLAETRPPRAPPSGTRTPKTKTAATSHRHAANAAAAKSFFQQQS